MTTAAAGPAADTAAADWRALGCAVRLVVTDPRRLDECRALLVRQLDQLDRACSRFRPDSELVRLDAADGRAVAISPLLTETLAAALRAAALTGGDVDPTVGTALDRLGYDRDFDLVQRDGRPIRLVVRPVPGWRRVSLDARRRTVAVPPGIRLDLGATAKAWAADRAARTLAAAAGCGVLVSLGGDTAVAGAAPGAGWRVRVQDTTGDPAATPHGPHSTVAVRDGGLATSGTCARQWRRGGRLLHHLVDPGTGLPADSPWRTASVAAGTCLDANIAATAAVIRGGAAPDWLAAAGLPARLVGTDGRVRTVAGWPEDSPGNPPEGHVRPAASERAA